jgi:Phage Tail Collar Domain
MADTFTSVLELRLQATGGNSDTWGAYLNSEVFQFLEDKIVGTTTVSTTGGDTTLTASQRRANIIKVTGSLVSNVVLIVANETSSWYVWNATTHGGFAVTIKTASGTNHQIASVPPACTMKVFCDASDGVFRMDDRLAGELIWIADRSLEVPPGLVRLPAHGENVSRTGIYRELFRLWGTSYGSGNGSTTFGMPDRDDIPDPTGIGVYIRL